VKTYISFMVRAFAIPQQRALRLRLECPRAFESPRVVRIERYDGVVGHYLRVVRPEDLDAELERWVEESYAHGAGERPAPRSGVRPSAAPPRRPAPTRP
jgi:hypothetical protein